MTERFLVAVDGSENSLVALDEAVRLAEVVNSKVYIVNVQPSFHTIHTRLFIKEELIKEYQKELFDTATKDVIERLQSKKCDYELLMRIGDPVQQISKLAKELEVRYIIIGSRGMGVVKGTVLGSVSHGILHESKIPVLIIPEQKK
jgi:nucleotide-binding universal stress UspA family protein